MRLSEKTICILAPTPEIERRLLQIFRNLDFSSQLPFAVRIITSLRDARDLHLLFFEVDPERMDRSREELQQILASVRPTDHQYSKECKNRNYSPAI